MTAISNPHNLETNSLSRKKLLLVHLPVRVKKTNVPRPLGLMSVASL